MTASPIFGNAIDVRIDEQRGSDAFFTLTADEHLSGRPGALHGGAIAAMFELAASTFVHLHFADRPDVQARPMGTSIEYLRAAATGSVRLRVSLVRQGTRIANITIEAWQEDAARPFAAAKLLYALRGGDREAGLGDRRFIPVGGD